LVSGERNVYRMEKKYRKKDGTYFYGKVTKSVLYNKENEPEYLIAILEDVTERKQAEENLKKTLKQKEALIAEIYHRVRNNLALISALFDLQCMYTEDNKVLTVLNDSKMRIKCLSFIHESYAQTEKTSHINFKTYLDQLIDFVSKTFETDKQGISIHKKIPDLNLNINQAVPAGLICNELLMQTFTQLKGKTETSIYAAVDETPTDLHLRISIKPGIEKQKSATPETESLSQLIIKTLIAQLQGNLEFNDNDNDSTYLLTFKKRNLKGPSSSMEPDIDD